MSTVNVQGMILKKIHKKILPSLLYIPARATICSRCWRRWWSARTCLSFTALAKYPVQIQVQEIIHQSADVNGSSDKQCFFRRSNKTIRLTHVQNRISPGKPIIADLIDANDKWPGGTCSTPVQELLQRLSFPVLSQIFSCAVFLSRLAHKPRNECGILVYDCRPLACHRDKPMGDSQSMRI